MNVKLLRKIDKYLIGFFILLFFWIKYFFVRKKNKIIKNPKKILVIRLWALGSSILTFPMIKQLEEHFGKGVQYDLLASTRNIGVFKNQGYFKNIYNLFSTKDLLKLICSFKKYDIIIDTEDYFMISALMSMRLGRINVGYKNIKVRGLAYNNGIIYNDKQHAVLTFIDLAKKVGVKGEVPENLEKLKYNDKDKIKVDNFLEGLKHGKLICMHTGLAETVKERARPKHKWVELIQKIADNDNKIKIVLSGSKGEYDSVQEIFKSLPKKYHYNVINICGMFNIFEFGYLLERCDLMVSNDTGPMHLSTAMRTKTIGLFGPNLPDRFGPYPLDKNISIYKGNGKASINVHLGQFEKDKNYFIDKIDTKEVFDNIIKHI